MICSASRPSTRRESLRNQHDPDSKVALHSRDAETDLRVPDANDNDQNNVPSSSNRVLTNAPTTSAFNNGNNNFMPRLRTGPMFGRQELENGAGEFPQVLFSRYGQAHPDGSSLFCGFLSSLPPQAGQRFDLDLGQEGEHHHYDEALNFVASAKRVKDERSEICADFVREHFKCPICLDVLIDPTALICGHRFCKLCIETWLKIKYTCPVCGNGVKTLLPQYDVENAINSVADYLSSEWQKRRLVSIESHQYFQPSTATTSSSPSPTPSHMKWAREIKAVLRRGSRYFRRSGRRWWRCTRDTAVQIYDKIELNDVVKGAFIGSFTVFLLFVAEDIIDFVQYMYYVMTNYDKSNPIMKQIQMFGLEVSKGQSKYRELPGGSETIFADFISFFYA